jgi:hypothetical protein
MKLLFLFFIPLICSNPFTLLIDYFIHDEKPNLNETQLRMELEFYRNIEKTGIKSTGVLTGITALTGIPLTLSVISGTLSVIPLTFPIGIGLSAFSYGFVSYLSRERKNEIRFRLSQDYKLWKKHLSNIIIENKKNNKYSRRAFMLSFFITITYFVYFMRYGKKNYIQAIITFLLICFINSYLLTMYIEYKKTIQNRENLIQKWGSECNWNLLTVSQKASKFFRTVEKETGYILNDPKCNKYKTEINEISITMLDIFTLMGIKNTILNLKLIYHELNILEKIFAINVLFIIIITVIFIKKYTPKYQNDISRKGWSLPNVVNVFHYFGYVRNNKIPLKKKTI